MMPKTDEGRGAHRGGDGDRHADRPGGREGPPDGADRPARLCPRSCYMMSFVGGTSGGMRLSLKPLDQRKRSSEEIAADLRKKLAGHRRRAHPHPGRARAGFQINLGPSRRQPDDRDPRLRPGSRPTNWPGGCRRPSRRSMGSRTSRLSREAGTPEEQIIIDRQKAADLHLTRLADRQRAADGAVGHQRGQLPRERQRVPHPGEAAQCRADGPVGHPGPEDHQRRRPAGRAAQRRDDRSRGAARCSSTARTSSGSRT